MSDNDSATARHEISLRSLGPPPSDDLKHLPLIGRDDVIPVPFVSEPARGEKDVQNITYINAIPNTLRANEQLKKLQLANELSSQYFSVKAAEAADHQIRSGALSTDLKPEAQIKRSNYRAKVIDYAMNRTGWFRISASKDYYESFDVEKKHFHKTLLDALLKGLPIPQSVYPEFEKVFTRIFEGVQLTQNQTISLTNWVLIFTYEYDKRQDRVFASSRTVYYEINQSMQKFASKKSNVTQVHVDLFYKQDDFALTESMWDLFKDQVIGVIRANGIINGPIVIPV